MSMVRVGSGDEFSSSCKIDYSRQYLQSQTHLNHTNKLFELLCKQSWPLFTLFCYYLLLENSTDDRFGQVVRCQTVIERYVSCYEKIQKIVEEMTFYEIN
jgi:hypothetical protein